MDRRHYFKTIFQRSSNIYHSNIKSNYISITFDVVYYARIIFSDNTENEYKQDNFNY